MKFFWLTFIAAFVLLVVPRLSLFSEPFGISVDESTYLTFGEIILRGDTLYQDGVDRKPPGLFYLYAGIQSVVGTWNIHGLHVVSLLFTLLLSFLAKANARTWMSFFLFLIFSACFPRGILALNAETGMLLFLGAAHLVLAKTLSARQPLMMLVASFAFVNLAALMKQYAFLPFGLAYLAWFYWAWRDDLYRKTLLLLSIPVGVMVTFGVQGLVYLLFELRGAGDEFLYWTWIDGFLYIGGSDDIVNNDTSFWFSVFGMIVSWLALWLAFFKAAREDRSPWFWIWFFGTLGAVLTAFLSGRYYTHYFLPAIWYLSVLVGPTVERVLLQSLRWRLILSVTALLSLVVFSAINFSRDEVGISSSFPKTTQEQMKAASAVVRKKTDLKDRILVWGMASQIYVMSERGSATPFVFSDFASGRLPGFKSQESRPLPGMPELFLESLQKNKPAMIVDTSPAGINDYGYFPLTRFPDFYQMIQEKYQRVKSVEKIDLWELRSRDDGTR